MSMYGLYDKINRSEVKGWKEQKKFMCNNVTNDEKKENITKEGFRRKEKNISKEISTHGER